MGYSVKDSKYLQKEIERQGLQKYINGDYVLGALNGFGQRISIRVEIENRNSGGTVSFITGWMVHANGRITLNTPYGGNDMKYLDCVELIVEKEKYSKEGVHKGMQGVIWLEDRIDGKWDVCFPQYGEKENIAEIPINEEDLVLLPNGMDARINEKIKAMYNKRNFIKGKKYENN